MSTGSPRQLWLLPVLLITVIATAVGALVARSVYKDPPPPPPAAVEPSPSAELPWHEQPGSSEVKGTADAMAHPLYGTLRSLLQQYVDAVNAKDFESWKEVVTAGRIENTPKKDWNEEFSTSRIGGITMYRIETGGDGTARVLLRFTSTQSKEHAPAELQAECIYWGLVWPFTKERGVWKLAAGQTSNSPQHEAC